MELDKNQITGTQTPLIKLFNQSEMHLINLKWIMKKNGWLEIEALYTMKEEIQAIIGYCANLFERSL